MHIKKIVIQGFKTYKNATEIGDISRHHNIVLGRNGSGKSNFFAGIRFVLSDSYTNMSREERQALIHEGSGNVMSAYVEVVFDNADGRIPINKKEISIRRTVGLKKDDYSMDGKAATRTDIMNLLESSGFLRSNPYYIVPQGRITHLMNSNDSERFQLLNTVSGATVFEKKVKDSQKEIENSNYKKQRIDETLEQIEERLSDLQIELSDLKEFQDLEKKKRGFEHRIVELELQELSQTILNLEDNYSLLLNKSKSVMAELEEREELCQQLTETVKQLKFSHKLIQIDKEQSEVECNQLLQSVTKVSGKEESIRAEMDLQKESNVENREKIRTMAENMKKSEIHLLEMRPEQEKLQKKETDIKTELESLVFLQRALYSKQNRFQRFRSKKERDEWLYGQISFLKSNLQKKDSKIQEYEREIENIKNKITEVEELLKLESALCENPLEEFSSVEFKKSILELKQQIDELQDRRKLLWREEVKLQSFKDLVHNNLIECESQMFYSINRNLIQGLEALEIFVEQLKMKNQVYGPLINLFSVSEKYRVAVEVIAGNSLFNFVVDNEDSASVLMDELLRNKSGRVTFIPLNRIEETRIEYPKITNNNFIPLISKLKYEDKFFKIMNHFFGRVLICNDLPSGSDVGKAYNLTAITLDGDRVDQKGVITGGFKDYKKSKIKAFKIQFDTKKELLTCEEDLSKCKDEINQINQNLIPLNNEHQLLVREVEKLRTKQESSVIKVTQLLKQKEDFEQNLKILNQNLELQKVSKNKILASLKQHENELDSEFTSILSEKECDDLEILNDKIKKLEKELDKVVIKLSEVETEINKYESQLNNNYKPHLKKLIGEQNDKIVSKTYENEMTDLRSELNNLNFKFREVEIKNKKLAEEYNKVLNEINESESTLKKANEQQMKSIKKLESISSDIEKNLNQKSTYTWRQGELQKKMNDLGILTGEFFCKQDFENYTNEELLINLNKVNESLCKYSHINKKAIDQFSLFTKQRDELVERRIELEKSYESIVNLMNNLQSKKKEAIKKSFKEVSSGFSEFFSKLVPEGRGELIIVKKNNNSQDVSKATNDSYPEDNEINNFSGVSISVSFNSKKDEQQRIEQLSGGQKSLCAIVLILSIQKCDPAPFYLFDEIDANLDAQYRVAVALLIKSLSENAQFICTTFRPEMLQVADKFYGVMYDNKVSTISEIDKNEALTFIEKQIQI